MSALDDDIAALLALDAFEPEEQVDAELRTGTFPAGYQAVAAALAENATAEPPSDLRVEVLAGALARRPPGRPLDGVAPCTAAEAFRRTVNDLRDLLDSLSEAEWDAPAHAEHGAVRSLIAHLVGVERLSVRWLDESDDVPVQLDHVASTKDVVAALVGADKRALAEQWHAAAVSVIDAAAVGDPNRVVTFHDLQMPISGFLVTRTFELWAHSMDISVATGRPLLRLGPERMALLSSRLMVAVPRALAYRQRTVRHRSVRFVLTGRAGGTYTVPLHPADKPGVPEATVVADVVDLCRVAARRLSPDELSASIDGDRELADLVLAGLDGFARD